jgi:hypothetical protein
MNGRRRLGEWDPGMLHPARGNPTKTTRTGTEEKGWTRCHITKAPRTSRKQWPKTRSQRCTSDMAWLRPSEREKMSRCDRSSCRQARTRTSTHGQAMSHQTRHRPPRDAGMAFPCPSREAPRSLAPRVGRGRHWLGCSRQPRSRCCLSTHDLGRTAAGRWSECPAPPVTTNKGMKKNGASAAKRAAHQKFDVLDGHLFRDSYSPHSSFHSANPFGLSLRFHVPRSICQNARLAAVYHDWARIPGIGLWCGVWILATQDADRNFR